MSDAHEIRIARARGEADAAKARLMATLDEVKLRLAPGKLASDAVQNAKNKGLVVADETVTAVKDRPLMAAGIAAAAAAFIARKPLVAAVGRWIGGDDEDDQPVTRRAHAGADKE
ncbi:hypothetical protein GCM10022281_20730 [Sphingomonas rosea]|uniref:DUF3618 domain-containing protein n=1 Tax=Sphingomonas rosea TaxID=335605 RepID=A0ABP7UBW9_9SPHN